jgi:hypothetical protein
MRKTAVQSNPFALMMSPELVLAAVERSERLSRLQRRICRPLDKIPSMPSEDGVEKNYLSDPDTDD